MAASLLLLALVSGCATAARDIALKPDESAAIVVLQAPQWPGPVEVHNEAVGKDSREALVGAGAGAVAGGAWGLACGPLAPMCVPLAALAGAEVGLLTGLAVGTTAALPADTASRLRDRTVRALQSYDLRRVLETDVFERAQGRWKPRPDHPTAAVAIELRSFALSSTRDERIRCSVKVVVTVRRDGQTQPPRTRERIFEYIGPYRGLANWLDEGPGFVEADLADASRRLAAQIVAGLVGEL